MVGAHGTASLGTCRRRCRERRRLGRPEGGLPPGAGGNHVNAYDTPIVSWPSAGAFTVAFRNSRRGIVGGGDLDPTDPNQARTATSSDGGRTWALTNAPPVTGAIFGL